MALSTLTTNRIDNYTKIAEWAKGSFDQTILYDPTGYLFIADQFNDIRFYRFSPGSVPSLTSTTTANFNCSNPQRLHFILNGANSILLATEAYSPKIHVFRFNPATVTGNQSPAFNLSDSRYTKTDLPCTISAYFDSSDTTKCLVFAANYTDSVFTFMWQVDLIGRSTNLTSATKTFSTSGTNAPCATRFSFNGANSILIVAELFQNRLSYYRFDPYAVGDVTAAAATFAAGNGPKSFDFYNDLTTPANSYLVVPDTGGGLDVRFYRFNSNSVSTDVTTPTATFRLDPVTATFGVACRIFPNGANTFVVIGNSSGNSISVLKFDPTTVASTAIPPFLIQSINGSVRTASHTINGVNLDSFICYDSSINSEMYRTNLDHRSIIETTKYQNQLTALSKVSGGVITLNSSLDSAEFLALLRSGAAITSSGLSTTVYGYAYSAVDDISGTLSESITFSGSARINDDRFSITTASGVVIKLGTAGTYSTETFTVPSGGIVEIGQNTVASKITLQAGAILRSVGGTYSLTIPYADPGVVLQGGATLITPRPTLTLTGFPSGSQIIVSRSGIQQDLVNNPTPPYIFTAANGATLYDVRITSPGFKLYTGQFDLVADISTPVVMLPATTTQTIIQPLLEFIGLISVDTAYLRVLSEAATVPALADELAMIKSGMWADSVFKTSWNTALNHASVTDPSVGEVAVWAGLLTTAGYTAISFTGTGRIN